MSATNKREENPDLPFVTDPSRLDVLLSIQGLLGWFKMQKSEIATQPQVF